MVKRPLDHRSNAFDLLRLAAALTVFWGHQYALSGMPLQLPPHSPDPLQLALFTFFAISGYLNTTSLLRSRDPRTFLVSRALRIYPALIVCTLFMVSLGAVVTTMPIADYVSSEPVASFALRNFTLLGGVALRLPGVFMQSAYPGAINGSLWTLPYEVYLYLLLACALPLTAYNSRVIWSALGIATIGAVGFTLLGGVHFKILPGVRVNYLMSFGMAFFVGGVIAVCKGSPKKRLATYAVIGSLAPLALAVGQTVLAYSIAGAMIAVLIGKLRLPGWMNPRRDLSYGIYIYAFPVQQLVVSLRLNAFWLSFASALALTLVLAVLSHMLIEAPALALKSRLNRRGLTLRRLESRGDRGAARGRLSSYEPFRSGRAETASPFPSGPGRI